MKQSDEKKSWFSETAQLFYFNPCVICSFSLPAGCFFFFVWHMYSKLGNPRCLLNWKSGAGSRASQKKTRLNKGTGEKCACSLNFCVCSLLPIRCCHFSLHFSKLEIEAIPGLIKHAEMCGDHKTASQFGLGKTAEVAVNLPSDEDRHLFISWKPSPSLNWKVSPGCCVEVLNHSPVSLCICSTCPFIKKKKKSWLEPQAGGEWKKDVGRRRNSFAALSQPRVPGRRVEKGEISSRQQSLSSLWCSRYNLKMQPEFDEEKERLAKKMWASEP